jgi:hypothetical protein
MVSKERAGPRGEFAIPPEERDRYENLILLCKIHHKMVDDYPEIYTVERLREIKAAHEKWVRESLRDFDPGKQRDNELYADYVDQRVRRAESDKWATWSSHVLAGSGPSMLKERDARLEGLRSWLFTRVWPNRYPELDAAFENFRRVLEDFQETFRRHAMDWGEALVTEKFYQAAAANPSRYRFLARRYDFHAALVRDLMLEFTRAANYICDRIRQYLDPMFRLQEGLLIAQSGPHKYLAYQKYRVEYRGQERGAAPYHGLEQFKRERKKRDRCFFADAGADSPESVVWVSE